MDGDEIYDPAGLSLLKKKILAGEYKDYTRIFGAVLNCISLDMETKTARGYLAPPCRTMTKLYNFALIEDCSDAGEERLHGKIFFKPGFEQGRNLFLHEQFDWDSVILRCIHVCFLPRTTAEFQENKTVYARENISELSYGGYTLWLKRKIARLFGNELLSREKIEKYQRGDIVEKDVTFFLR